MRVKFTTELTRKQFTVLTGGVVFMMGVFFTGVNVQSNNITDNSDLTYKKVVEHVNIEPVGLTAGVMAKIYPINLNIVKETVEEVTETIGVIENTYYQIPKEYKAIGADFTEETQDFLREICEERNLDFYIVLAQIEAESGYRSYAKGDNGRSIGYMQINTRWSKDRMDAEGVTNLYNPKENIKVGTCYLKDWYEKYEGDWHKVLMCYNMGEKRANELWREGKYSSKYSTKILNRAEEIKQELLQED